MDKKIKDLEDMRNEINVIYAEKLEKIIGQVDPSRIKAHQ